MSKKSSAILLALLAAVFYAVNTPFSKLLLGKIPVTFMASFLYLGAGIGIGILYLVHGKKDTKVQKLGKRDLPYTIGMIVLDILAPILLMFGIKLGTASNASLLGNFEIVATALIALLLFKEAVSRKLWIAISLIVVSSILLSFDGVDSLKFSPGSLLVLLAAMCWGLENNCTRKISNKSTYEIVILKGFFSGGGSFVIALFAGEKIPQIKYILPAMLLGFVAYGLSIFTYIRAQRELGAAKTSAYYAIAPFIGAFLSFIFLDEILTAKYLVALLFMAVGTVFAVVDTLQKSHSHLHSHTVIHTHDGQTHEHMIFHSHEHHHYVRGENHNHHHNQKEIEYALEPFHDQ